MVSSPPVLQLTIGDVRFWWINVSVIKFCVCQDKAICALAILKEIGVLVCFDMVKDQRTVFFSKLSKIFEPIYINILTRSFFGQFSNVQQYFIELDSNFLGWAFHRGAQERIENCGDAKQ